MLKSKGYSLILWCLKSQKIRFADYLDERSAYLTQFVGENALKGFDEASARMMENPESQMQAFQETPEME
uniref:Uncharacterized protein n=1 Tax=Nelumbo nucifera TaxID=4432 RepID=A0A822Y8M6_NELNU|nr:TPA_asm: hypothetical protein HUJ06_029881 [Nelumbo nucifera]